MKFATAAFGVNYRSVCNGLIKTFNTHNTEKIHVFTDMPNDFENAIQADLYELISDYPEYYQIGSRRNVFKFEIIKYMQELYPGEMIAWLDSDMLVFDDLKKHIKTGKVNVVTHGKNRKGLNLGNGLTVSGYSDYFIGGFFAVPPDNSIDTLVDLTYERLSWQDNRDDLGDQLILNHFAHRNPKKIYRLSDDRRYHYNLGICTNHHPVVNDRGLQQITIKDGKLFKGKPIVIFPWIKNKFDQHYENDFATFSRPVREFLQQTYKE